MLAFTHKTYNSGIDQAKSFAVDQPCRRGVGAGDDQTEGNANDGEDDGRQVQACLDASVERQRSGKDNDESEGYVDEADEIASGQQDPQSETEECQAADETGNGFGLLGLRLPPAINPGYRCKQQGDANDFADDVQGDVVTDNQKDSECRQSGSSRRRR